MNKKILLVEDEAMIRDMYEMILKKKGYELEIAEDGEIALNKIKTKGSNFGLILLDIMLPKLDGLSVLKEIKKPESPTKDIPVFLLTNLGQENLIKEAMAAGAAQYWIKSNIFPMDLVKEIDSFLNKTNPQTPTDSNTPAENNTPPQTTDTNPPPTATTTEPSNPPVSNEQTETPPSSLQPEPEQQPTIE